MHSYSPAPTIKPFSPELDTSTLIPPEPDFPFLLPPPPRPHPTPLPARGRVRLLSRRNLVAEANDLSDEEAEVDDSLLAIRNRGASFLVPLGKKLTLLEEQADMQGSSDGGSTDPDGGSDHAGSQVDEADEEEEQDLDASMDNLDEEDDDGEDEEEDEEDEDDDEEEEEEEEESDEGEDDSDDAEIQNQLEELA